MRRNAFVIRGPVPPDKFFDRREEVNAFVRMLESESYDILIAVIAPFKFGKTSLLLKLYTIAREHRRIIPVMLRLNVVERPVWYVIRCVSSQIPSAGEELEQVYRSVIEGKEEPFVLFEKLNRLLESRDLWLVLFVDEFQCLGEMMVAEGFLKTRSPRHAFDFLKGVTEEVRIGLVVSGSLVGQLHDAIRPWAGRFTVFHLGRFPREDSIEMLSRLFEMSGMRVDEEKLEYIAYSVNDHPYYMQLFGYHLVSMGRVDEDAIEAVRSLVESLMLDYYDARLVELMSVSSSIVRVLRRIAEGATVFDFQGADLRDVVELERAGIVYRRNSRLFYYDDNFRNYILRTVAGELRERFLPSYTAEYVVARKLYAEGFREILVAYMSWGPFDIVVPLQCGARWGVGIQVKETSKDSLGLGRDTLETLLKAADDRGLAPVIAVHFKHRRVVKYYPVSKSLTRVSVDEGYETLREAVSRSMGAQSHASGG